MFSFFSFETADVHQATFFFQSGVYILFICVYFIPIRTSEGNLLYAFTKTTFLAASNIGTDQTACYEQASLCVVSMIQYAPNFEKVGSILVLACLFAHLSVRLFKF